MEGGSDGRLEVGEKGREAGGTALYERGRGRQPPGRCKRLMRWERERDERHANDCELGAEVNWRVVIWVYYSST